MDNKNEKMFNLTRSELNNEKNKVIARFASVASHDLKNVLGGLSNIAYYLSKALKVENETQKKMLTLLSTEVNNLNTKIVDLLDMTRVKQLTKKSCNLKDIINKAIEENKIDTIIFETKLEDVKILADSQRMTQVFSNIIKNAKDAMKNNGSINIVMNINNDIVSVSLKDTGIGMNQETLENCFDPMFSTKTAKAVGMGLTVAKQVVEMHNGTISVDSIENQGTTIDITLPVLKEE
jgi:signal transduction histidine kinase